LTYSAQADGGTAGMACSAKTAIMLVVVLAFVSWAIGSNGS
jgi:hypothetical protein